MLVLTGVQALTSSIRHEGWHSPRLVSPLGFTLDSSCCTVEAAALVPVVRTAMFGSRETAHSEFFPTWWMKSISQS